MSERSHTREAGLRMRGDGFRADRSRGAHPWLSVRADLASPPGVASRAFRGLLERGSEDALDRRAVFDAQESDASECADAVCGTARVAARGLEDDVAGAVGSFDAEDVPGLVGCEVSFLDDAAAGARDDEGASVCDGVDGSACPAGDAGWLGENPGDQSDAHEDDEDGESGGAGFNGNLDRADPESDGGGDHEGAEEHSEEQKQPGIGQGGAEGEIRARASGPDEALAGVEFALEGVGEAGIDAGRGRRRGRRRGGRVVGHRHFSGIAGPVRRAVEDTLCPVGLRSATHRV